MTLLIISFVAGVLTVLSPCILPLLPVVVGGSLSGERSLRRALTVTVALGVSVFVSTFLLKVSTAFINVPPSFWNFLSGGIILIIGLLFLFPRLWDLIPGTAAGYRGSNALMSSGFMRHSFTGDVLVGAALGPVFSTCSPTYFIVLATVLPVSLALGAVDILAYILGLCLSLLVISFVGQRVLDRLGMAADNNGVFKRALGGVFVLIGLLIVSGLSARVEAPLYNLFDETKLEQYILQRSTPSAPSASAATSSPEAMSTTTASATTTAMAHDAPAVKAPASVIAMKNVKYTKAPELVTPDGYLNTQSTSSGQANGPITLAQYRGKNVVLLDFWTYSCINCERTLPYLTTWYSKYKDQGLVIIGVHTPEFAFERVQANVALALKKFGITYPVVLDNEYQTWNAYGNRYWPHEYVIDIDGYIVHDHIGEGEYDQTEKAIQAALAERVARLNMNETVPTTTVSIPAPDLSGVNSPETYFGSARNEYLGNGTPSTSGTQKFSLPTSPNLNRLYLGGTWDISSEYATNGAAGDAIEYDYSAKNLYFVASGMPSGTQVEVLQDGAPVASAAGKDVVNGVVTIKESRLYHLVANPTAGEHTLKLIIKSPGLAAYTLTFG